jgi:hypothetical protein
MNFLRLFNRLNIRKHRVYHSKIIISGPVVHLSKESNINKLIPLCLAIKNPNQLEAHHLSKIIPQHSISIDIQLLQRNRQVHKRIQGIIAYPQIF